MTPSATVETIENEIIETKNELRSIREIVKDLSKPIAQKHLRKRRQGGKEILYLAWHDAVKYLDREAKVDPAVIQTVLNWENKGETSVNEFFDNSIIDRIIKEGFVERLYK